MLPIYQEEQTVFRLIDIAMITGITNYPSLNKKINYQVRTGNLLNPRKGIYTKPGYSKEELGCKLYTPAYISLHYVLQKAGAIFQYDPAITLISYLNRKVEIENQPFQYRKIKSELLVNTAGIYRKSTHVNIATPERAMLDLLYLNPNAYFDSLNMLDDNEIYRLVPLYASKALYSRVDKLLQNV